MPPTHSPNSNKGDEFQFESFDSLYDRGLPIPKGEWVEILIDLFLTYRRKSEPAPLDLLAHLQQAGIIVDEFERFVDDRLALAARLNSRHIAIN